MCEYCNYPVVARLLKFIKLYYHFFTSLPPHPIPPLLTHPQRPEAFTARNLCSTSSTHWLATSSHLSMSCGERQAPTDQKRANLAAARHVQPELSDAEPILSTHEEIAPSK